MPEVVKCPSCGGSKVTFIEHGGKLYYQCASPVKRERGSGRNRATTSEPCKYWSTKWQPSKSS